ncbi:MAG TPA: cobyrinate a,c-diamide synthase [Methylophilaceae bacterium]|jgi:cobyrinic acid a,c-diamide synthase
MQTSCPAVLISATSSGQGKTLCSAALACAWRNRGLRVQVFKCGPDFLDPMILEVASGRAVYNLDLGMCGEQDAERLLYKAAQESDVILLEGVMGLFDGQPSSADIALRFGIPVALIIDASAMAQTFGALAAGLLGYNPAIKPAGVIANQIGSSGHADFLRSSLPANIPWLGALPKDNSYSIPERHLGLHRASETHDLDARIEAAAKMLPASSTLPLPPTVTFNAPAPRDLPPLLTSKTIAIARDEAFCFIYPANLDCLRELGAALTFFSPLQDTILPEADAYWLPGGYPELHMQEISANVAMKQQISQAFAQDKPILAECGGMMALCESVNGIAGFGLLPGISRVESGLQGIGTQHVQFDNGKISAHTFHHGVFETLLQVTHTSSAAFGKPEPVYRHGSLHASFLHFYFPSNPHAAARFFLP